jgi:hypothetical protein
VKYELGFYTPEDGILLSHRHEHLKFTKEEVTQENVCHCAEMLQADQ